MTFELNRRHWNWWGSAEVFKFVLKKRTPESPLGRIENITINGETWENVIDSGYLLRWQELTSNGRGPEELPPLRPRSGPQRLFP